MKAPFFLFVITLLTITPDAFLWAFTTVPRSSHLRTASSSALLMATTAAVNIDKNIYRPDKVDENEFDTVVIGSGIGGLTTACLLAQQGQKVCVLEQHYVAGGAMHTFRSHGYRFATGIHYVGEMGEDDQDDVIKLGKYEWSFKRLLDSITPKDDPVIWDKLNEHFETAIFGDPASSSRHYEIVAGEGQWKKKLYDQFPKEKKAINKYFKLVKKARRSIHRAYAFKTMPLSLARIATRTGLHRLVDGGLHKWSHQTMAQVVERLTNDKELQALLAYNYGVYGVEPDRAPFLSQAFAATHYMNGAWYPHGGPSEIAKRVIQSINDCGGMVLVKAPVKKILLENDEGNSDNAAAVGVEMMDGNIIKSKSVVSDAGFINTATKLLPPDTIDMDFAKDTRATFGKLHPSCSGINLFVGLKGDYKSLRLPESQYWIFPSNDLSGSYNKISEMSLDDALKMDPKDMGPIFVGIPSTKDKAWASEHPDKTGLEIITFVPWHWFEEFARFDDKSKSHGAVYESVKQQLAEKVWTRLVEVLGAAGAVLPEKLDDVDHYEVGTPLTFAHYYNSVHGSFYGLDHDAKRFEPETFFLRLRPEVPEVRGLFMCGQDVAGDGMVNAMAAGLLCAQKVLGILNPLSLLRDQGGDVASEECVSSVEGAGMMESYLASYL